MSERYEVRLAGLGGQGLILAGIIFAEAAGIHDGFYVTQTQSYGAAARGGFSRSDVVMSDEEIHYPKASQLDLLLTMSQSAYEENFKFLKPAGVLLIDSTYVTVEGREDAIIIPFSRIARDKFGRENVANIIALGAITQVFPQVSTKSMEKAVLNRVPKAHIELNKNAFEEGVKAGKKALADLKEGAKRVKED
ncbi:MAG: 2-oxoacid:acceptor oxidoreductase family protein [Proteobacteria bacterium]|jgi:2-oxoglutarate ferredoxin oxidoreductase subunit gamma|nr:2-oxoacid:acceptor oxidoreductase family protein [Pseudomonadota bacterium]